MGLASFREKLLDILYPRELSCAICGKEALTQDGVCEGCVSKLAKCSQAEVPDGMDGFIAAFLYNDALRKVIHRFKYENEPHLAYFLAKSIVVPLEWDIDIIVPVPLHPKKQRERGYNQSELLAREISRRTGVPADTSSLRRIRETVTQTELSEYKRRLNIKGAFAAAKKCGGRRILLIDDVRTTGSTLSECAAELRKAGAAAVYGASAAVVTTTE